MLLPDTTGRCVTRESVPLCAMTTGSFHDERRSLPTMKPWPRSRQVLALTSVAFFLTALDFTIVNVAFRAIERDFGSSAKTVLPWTLSGYAIAFAAGLLTAGRMADSFGRKRWFLLGTVVFTTASALCGIAPSAQFLVGARVIQALGGAMLVPAATALLLPEFPVERRSEVMGLTAMMGSIAAATGPALGGLLVTHLGWRWVFFVNLPFCVATVFYGSRLLRESKDPTASRRPDFIGAALAIGAVALLTLAIIQGESWGWGSVAEIGTLVVAAAMGTAFVLRCRTHTTPVLDLSLLRLRFVSAANVACLLWSMGFYAMFFNHVAWLQDVWHYSGQRSGAAILPGPLFATMSSPIGGRLAHRVGHLRVFVSGALLVGGAVLFLSARLGGTPMYVTQFLPSICIIGVGIGLVIASLTSAANAFLPSHRFGMGSALYNTNRQVGAAIGIAIATAIHSVWPGATGITHTYVYVAIAILVAAGVMLGFYRRPTEAELAASSAPVAAAV
jgi:EmrB/QacA subfamily drug resistance transporter